MCQFPLKEASSATQTAAVPNRRSVMHGIFIAHVPGVLAIATSTHGRLTSNNLRNQLAVHVRQPHVAAIEIISEPLVVEPHFVEQCRVKIENADRLLHHPEA